MRIGLIKIKRELKRKKIDYSSINLNALYYTLSNKKIPKQVLKGHIKNESLDMIMRVICKRIFISRFNEVIKIKKGKAVIAVNTENVGEYKKASPETNKAIEGLISEIIKARSNGINVGFEIIANGYKRKIICENGTPIILKLAKKAQFMFNSQPDF